MALSEIEGSQKIRYQRMPELVKEQLMDWIMDGSISMGDKLNAEDLAAKMGVSRMPVREALKSMEKSGIVRSVPYVGTRVAELEMTDIAQIYLMREALEPIAAYYACKNITAPGIQRIEGLHQELENVINGPTPDAKRIFVLNREFHFKIYETGDMHYMIDIIATLWDNLAFYKLIYGRKYTTDKSSGLNMLNEHKAYIDKLKEGDAGGIKTLMHESLHRRLMELKDSVAYEI
jgi:Transcriptional regulators